MNCPGCEHGASRVLESRTSDAGDAMRRRRECLGCTLRFTTYERAELPVLWVTKQNGRQEPFDRTKVLRGLARACSKREVTAETLERLVATIERGLRSGRDHAVASSRVGELALDALAGVDHVAYVRFASVLRAFDGIDEFQAEVERVQRSEEDGGLATTAALT